MIKLEYGSADYQDQVQAAFLGLFRMPKDADGNDVYTAAELVELHVENFIEGVRKQHVEKVQTESAVKAIPAPSVTFENSKRARVKQLKELEKKKAEEELAAKKLAAKQGRK